MIYYSLKYRLFSWEHSPFSGKVRAYLRYKDYFHDLGEGYEDILATPQIQEVMLKATGTNVVPQLLTQEGQWIQDSSEIIDYLESRHSLQPVIPGPERPLQRLVNYLIELFADEFAIVYVFWTRWHYSLPGVSPNHEVFNAHQWGAYLAPFASGVQRREIGRKLFKNQFKIHDPSNAVMQGPYSGLVELGVTEETISGWANLQAVLLEALENHFDQFDFIFGGRPSLADFSLLGPLYAHTYRDPVSGFELRTQYPLVTEWIERTNGTNALNARSYNQKLFKPLADGTLASFPATSHGGEWTSEDGIPETLYPILDLFFREMWPVLIRTMSHMREYFAREDHVPGAELPGRSWTATPGFEAKQRGDGSLTHTFNIGNTSGRRMVMPYQIWMLQRLAGVIQELTYHPEHRQLIQTFLSGFNNGEDLLSLDKLLEGCRLHKDGGRIFEDNSLNR